MTEEYIPPVVNANPPLAMEVAGDHRSNYHNALLTVSYFYNTLQHGEFHAHPVFGLLQLLKKADGTEGIDLTPYLAHIEEATGYHDRVADGEELQALFNLVLIDHKVYKSKLYFVPIDAKDEESASRYVETFSVLINAGVNRIIREMEARRGQKVATVSEVKTVLTPTAAKHDENESDSFSPVIIDARLAENGSWCVLMVLLDDVEAMPDPIITGMLSVVRESIEAFMDHQRPAPVLEQVQKTDPPSPSNSEGNDDAISSNASC